MLFARKNMIIVSNCMYNYIAVKMEHKNKSKNQTVHYKAVHCYKNGAYKSIKKSNCTLQSCSLL